MESFESFGAGVATFACYACALANFGALLYGLAALAQMAFAGAPGQLMQLAGARL